MIQTDAVHGRIPTAKTGCLTSMISYALRLHKRDDANLAQASGLRALAVPQSELG